MDIILNSGRLLQSLNSEEDVSSHASLLLAGVFCLPGTTRKTLALQWSLLDLAIFENKSSPAYEDLLQHLKNWIVNEFSNRFAAFDDTVTRLWKQEPRPCINCSVRGKEAGLKINSP